MDDFLATVLTRMNDMTESELAQLRACFLTSMELNQVVFGVHAFRKHRPGQDRRSVLNLSLFDVFSVSFARADATLIRERKEALRAGFHALMASPEFERDITYGTSGRARVVGRFAQVSAMIQKALS